MHRQFLIISSWPKFFYIDFLNRRDTPLEIGNGDSLDHFATIALVQRYISGITGPLSQAFVKASLSQTPQVSFKPDDIHISIIEAFCMSELLY